nr:pyrroline-5-carboxylate reductase [Maliibacterium massiliense]
MELGFIGIGNMAGAIMEGILRANLVASDDVLVSDINEARLAQLQEKWGVRTTTSNADVASQCDTVVLAVKPFVCQGVLEALRDAQSWRSQSGQVIISIVSGWSAARLYTLIPRTPHILHIMPNTPAAVGEGLTAFSTDNNLTEAEMQTCRRYFEAIGRVECVPEKMINALTGICGCGPAYFYMFMEALADAGVAKGLPRDLAYRLAAQTAVGSGKMVLESGMHPGALKDAVCSPAGSTIEAVHALEQHNFRGAVMDAVYAAADRMDAMSKE